MQVPRKIMTRIELFTDRQDESVYIKLVKYFKRFKLWKRACITGFGIYDEPCGRRRKNGEYFFLRKANENGKHEGIYFYPVQSTDKFVGVEFEVKIKGEE